MPLESEGNPEAQYEQLYEAIFGQLDELVAEAEDLVDEQGGGAIHETPDTAQLWAELQEQYRTVRDEFDRRRHALGEALAIRLASDLDFLQQRAEKAFGARLE